MSTKKILFTIIRTLILYEMMMKGKFNSKLRLMRNTGYDMTVTVFVKIMGVIMFLLIIIPPSIMYTGILWTSIVPAVVYITLYMFTRELIRVMLCVYRRVER